ncbi:MAG TPA: undecaprenyldiphospho-muramoylpentapeptide beta-N-acetylglucosaminyltransferase [Terriglobia bacterium]|jgi:UDP-N-acetylglucosamine--N-acetylmuramyl-(pentapeptide) pyrophosphoryl-undecaprenol N-acetylglucosamine transferase|nr:undecaprenyldiphospho-muramoylpentapeptide beta-N-acetylglucosaminyltransferase [Terriglobia bacterium]
MRGSILKKALMDVQSELVMEKEHPLELSARRTSRRVVTVLMAAGGTGGHIFPALAVADELRRRSTASGADATQYEAVFLGTGRGLESRIIPRSGYRLETVPGAGLMGISGWKRVLNFIKLPQSAAEAARVLFRLRPAVVLGIGGYISGPVMLEAALAGIPTLLYEANVVPGFTNRVLAPFVRLAAVGFEQSLAVYGSKGRLTGHPVRQEFFEVRPKPHEPPFTVLIVGGSQGARALNQCLAASLPLFRSRSGGTLRFIHQTGEADYNSVKAAYANHWAESEIRPFIDDIAGAFSRADLIICRAGATTVAELAAAGKASILVPYPSAADQHQLQNARALEAAGAARVIEQRDLTPDLLVESVMGLLSDAGKLSAMEQRARSLASPGAAGRIADLIEELCRKPRHARASQKPAQAD